MILVDVEKRLLWANAAALDMHGVKDLLGLGSTLGDYRHRFTLRYRNNRTVDDGEHPVDCTLATGKRVEATLEVRASEEHCWMHAIDCFKITDIGDEEDYVAWTVQDRVGDEGHVLVQP